MHLRENIVFAFNHEPIIGSWSNLYEGYQMSTSKRQIKYVICDKLGRDLYLLGILKKMFVIFNDFSYNIDDCF